MDAPADEFHGSLSRRGQPDPLHHRARHRHLSAGQCCAQDCQCGGAAACGREGQWAPGAQALLCIRPHALQIVGLGHPEALRATVNASVWRGATTRVVLSVAGMADRLIEVDAPGHTGYPVGTEVGVRFPEPAGVLVQAGR